ncbi:MAG: hypothetical protein WCM76_16725 [Bacteroidota bacterium]
MPAFIYSSIPAYRFAMNLLYAGAYRRRSRMVFNVLKGNSVTECCFGDTLLAEQCTRKGWIWHGYDINKKFVERARNKGFDAHEADLFTDFPAEPSDECVMMGSLYHFGENAGAVIMKMLEISGRVIISEPIKNLSNANTFTGRLFAKFTAAGNGPETFRFTELTLSGLLGELKKKHNFTFEIAGRIRKDILFIITKTNEV